MLNFLRFSLCAVALATSYPAAAVDLEKGKEINGTCAACHSDNGQGGKRGEYPRIAGQQVKYIESQLKSFRARTRVNIPMFPYTQERELSDADIKDIAAYLNGIELDTKMPTYTGTEDALTKLRMAEKVMIIPRVEGDLVNGERIFQKQCAACHGADGRGNTAMGAPNLTDTIWLFGGNKEAVVESIAKGRNGHMPAWKDQLGEEKIHLLAAYVYSLSLGK